MKDRQFRTARIREVEVEDGLVRVIASTPDVDRYGDIVEPSWNEKGLEQYRKNPVILWQHDATIPAIGRAEKIELVGKNLVADIRFDDSPENQLARLVKSQVERGFLNSVSVGFSPGKSTPRASLPVEDERHAKSGFVYSDSSLHELSIVNIPANPAALALRSGWVAYSVNRSEHMDEEEGPRSVGIPAPDGHHWMDYKDGPVLMVGEDADHPGASKTFEFEILSEHDPDRLKDEYNEEGYGSGSRYEDTDDEDTDDRALASFAPATKAAIREVVLEVLGNSDRDLIQRTKEKRKAKTGSKGSASKSVDPISSLFGC